MASENCLTWATSSWSENWVVMSLLELSLASSYSLDEHQRSLFWFCCSFDQIGNNLCCIWGKEQIDEKKLILFHIVWSEVQPSTCALWILNLWCFFSLKLLKSICKVPATLILHLIERFCCGVLTAGPEVLMGFLTCLQMAFGGGWW